MFEADAAVILALIDDVNEVIFKMNEEEYSYSINDINDIFGDVKEKSLTAIEDRYSSSKFKNYIYYGRINGYDVFDTSEVCEENLQKLYEDVYTVYYLECSTLDNILLYSDDEIINIKEALSSAKITITDITQSYLPVVTKVITDEDNS